MSQFNSNGISTTPIHAISPSGSIVFFPSGLYSSSLLVTGSDYEYQIEASSSFVLESSTLGKHFQFRTPSSSLGTSDDKIQFFISNSIAPKIGIGTSNPLATLDIVDVEDTAEGFLFLIRNARTVTKGGDPGDAAGTINFVITSGSYDKIDTSGSVGKIVSEVDAINTEGVGGHIRFEVSDTNTSNLSNNPVEVLRLVKDSSDIDDVTVKVTGSLSSTVKIKAGTAVEAGTYVDANTYLRGNSLKIGVTTEPGSGNAIILGDLKVTNITGSIISASGDITGSDVYIDDWGSVSASLASAGGGGAVTTYTNGVDNRIITSTGTDSINGEANLTFDGSDLTVSGDIEAESILVKTAGISSTGDYGAGSRIYIGNDIGTISAGKVYYLASTGWELSNSGAETTAGGFLAIRTSKGTNSFSGMLTEGVIKVGTNLSSSNIGDKVYLLNADGALTTTLPTTSGLFVRIVGYVVTPSTSVIYFNPSPDYIELT